jgi:hypothetical protein
MVLKTRPLCLWLVKQISPGYKVLKILFFGTDLCLKTVTLSLPQKFKKMKNKKVLGVVLKEKS